MPGVSVLASDRDYLSVTVGGTASDFHRLALRTPVMYSFAIDYHNVDKTASLFAEDRDCVSIVMQLAAVRSGIEGIGAIVLNNCMKLCFYKGSRGYD
jgi:hypothetical protein